MPKADLLGLAGTMQWLEPAANRLVFYGIATCRPMLDARHGHVRGDEVVSGHTGVIATVPLNRLISEVGSHVRTRERHAYGESWTLPDGTRLAVSSVTQAHDPTDTVLLEYATLLTQQAALCSGHVVRVVSLSVQLALLWRAHARSGHEFAASTYIEDIVEIAARRPSLGTEVAALPGELRAIIAHDVARFCASDTALWVVTRAIRDARGFAGVAIPVLARLESIAAFAGA